MSKSFTPAPTKMYYVYLIKSVSDKNFYIGSTNDLRRRLSEHNSGLVFSTQSRRPFELVYYEAYRSEKDASPPTPIHWWWGQDKEKRI